MSRIDELIPGGVEYLRLGDVVTCKRGKQLKEVDRTLGHFPVVTAGKNENGTNGESNFGGPSVTISSHGAYAGRVSYWSGPIWLANNVFLALPNPKFVLPRFLYFVLKNVESSLRSSAQGGGIPYINWRDLAGIRIPVPPLKIQHEIVRILDNFTELEAKLEAELECRRQQFKHFHGLLLASDREAEWLPLSDICMSISAGGDLPIRLTKGQSTPSEEFPYPIFSNGTGASSLYGFTDSYKVDKESVTISARGTIGHHAVRAPKFTPIVRLLTLVPDPKWISVRFLNYALDATEISHSGGSIPQLTVPAVKKIKVPVPPLLVQEQIVAILDKFDTLMNDPDFGLTAELAARRKQYEYYLDRLLTFEEAGA